MPGSGPIGGHVVGSGKTIKRYVPMQQLIGEASWRPKSTSSFVQFLMKFPDIWHRSDLRISVLWQTANSTTTNTITFRARYAAVTMNSSSGGALKDPTLSALDTTISADTVIAADIGHESPQGAINPGTPDPEKLYLFQIDVSASDLTLGSASSDNVQLLGVFFEYVPAALGGI